MHPTPSIHRLGRGLPGYLILFAPHAFAPQCQLQTKKPPSPLVFFQISTYFTTTPGFRFSLLNSRFAVSEAVLQLSCRISPLTNKPAYAPFTPSESGQRLPPTYYRGCWHVVGRGFLLWYRLLPTEQSFTTRRPSSLTRRRCVRVPPIAQDSPLLPPVGVWAVSQSQCGRTPSQAGYPSSPWWAVTPPTS